MQHPSFMIVQISIWPVVKIQTCQSIEIQIRPDIEISIWSDVWDFFPHGCEQSQAECEGQMKYLSVTAVVGKVTTIMSGRSGIELHQPCFTFTCLFRHLTRKFFLALAYFLCRNHLWHSQIHPLLTLKPTSGKFHINSKVIDDNIINFEWKISLVWKKRMFFQSWIEIFLSIFTCMNNLPRRPAVAGWIDLVPNVKSQMIILLIWWWFHWWW